MTDFLKPFLLLKSTVNLKTSHKNNVVIDNAVFQLHYRATAILLFVFTVLVTSRQYIGEHIKCIVGGGLSSRVVSSFCFFTSTFTVVDHINPDLVENGTLPHLGVGPYSAVSEAKTIEHAYYQWVPFMLFGQGIMFLLTHLLWKKWEGGKIRALMVGLENAAFAFGEKEIKGGKGQVPSVEKKRLGVELIRDQFIKNNYVTAKWPIALVTCEVLNVLHVIFQMYITNKFLGGIFWSLGWTLLDDFRTNNEVLDTHFPR
ncbi:hypothetical protein WA026_002751 [Henosepilachna vigintioctopunctata]|uniref:Innexin n=1 Tax=Henosepilachna vigintioctopunctata TaxID=420089 RepID=A0AAW1U186_9CUCU